MSEHPADTYWREAGHRPPRVGCWCLPSFSGPCYVHNGTEWVEITAEQWGDMDDWGYRAPEHHEGRAAWVRAHLLPPVEPAPKASVSVCSRCGQEFGCVQRGRDGKCADCSLMWDPSAGMGPGERPAPVPPDPFAAHGWVNRTGV